jgi:hypothetical protein
MSWGYHTIFPPTKKQDKADSPHHPSNADDDGTDDDDDADNDATENNADNDADNNTDDATAMQMMTMMQPQTMLPQCR